MSKDLLFFDDIPGNKPFAKKDEEQCPICSRWMGQAELESHVNQCLIDSEKSADPFSISVLEEEKRQYEAERKKKEDDEFKLTLQLLEDEERQRKKSREEASKITCIICSAEVSEKSVFLDACSHCGCRECLVTFVSSKLDQGKTLEVKCLAKNCDKPFSAADVKDLLGKERFEAFEKAQFLESIRGSKSNFIQCPNKECGNVMEKLEPSNRDQNPNETGPDGKPLSKEAITHKNANRFRCRDCQTEFCAECSGSPYHLGFTCVGFKSYQAAKHCRFCNTQLSDKNTSTVSSAPGLKGLVCTTKECVDKARLCCGKVLGCGHFCCGISGEKECPSCLHEDCAEKAKLSQNGEDFCNICWVESLSSAPSIRLKCGHFFHASCCKNKLVKQWTGSRITFGFWECALCKERMEHPFLKQELDPLLKLHEEVKVKAIERLKALNLATSEEITKNTSKWYNNPEGYSLYRFSYFPCYKCKKPYFGGERVCEGNAQQEFDPKELVCGGCSDFAAAENCPKHGKEYIEYKCKFCCNVAVWFCWGNTHFCEDCHKKASTIPNVPKKDLPKCTCGIKHPPNGEEYLLGCSVCRLLAMTHV